MANHGVPAIIPANAASKDVDISEPTSPFARDKSDTAAHTEQHMKHEDLGPLPLKQSPFFTRAPFIIGQELCERMACKSETILLGLCFIALACCSPQSWAPLTQINYPLIFALYDGMQIMVLRRTSYHISLGS